jgi:hypothetical protein
MQYKMIHEFLQGAPPAPSLERVFEQGLYSISYIF